MPISSDAELRRQLEEPLSCECRNYPLAEDRILVTMMDTPYYPPYMPDALHYHNCLEIGMCLAGGGQLVQRGVRRQFSAGSVIVTPRGVYHSQQNTGEPLTHWRYLIINEHCLLRRTPERFGAVIRPFLESIRGEGLFLESSADSGIDTLFKLMFDLRRRDDADVSLELELCVCLLLMQIASQAGRSPLLGTGDSPCRPLRQPIEPALAYVYEHYKEDVQIGDLARSCSMSESYFRKQFGKLMGMSPLEYVNRYRVHRAMNLLRTTGDPIQIVAVRAGFSSLAAFNRNFQQYAGTSPSGWRRSHFAK